MIPRIVDGLTALGVSPHPGGPPPKRLSFAPVATPGGGVRRTPRRAVLAAVVAAVVLVAGGVVAVLALRDGSEPAGTSTGTPTPSASATPSATPTSEPTDQGTPDSTAGLPDAATTPVVTGKGKARVSARLVSKYCNLAGDCKTAPSGRRFLLLDVTAWQSGADLGYDPDLSMEAFGSLVLFQGERVTPNESMLLEGPPAGMTVVYPTLPRSAAGADVILHWPDNPALRVHVKG